MPNSGQRHNNESMKAQQFLTQNKSGLKQLPALLKKLKSSAPEGFDWNVVGLDNTELVDFLNGNSQELDLKEFELLDGRKVKFAREIYTPTMLKENVTISLNVNGRDQKFLNDHSVQDLSDTLCKGQWFPCIACPSLTEDGKVEWLDGSRRRYVGIKDNLSLDVYIALEAISEADAQYIASTIQSSHKPHSTRELGLRCLQLVDEGYPDTLVMEKLNISKSTFDRANRAARIPCELLLLITDQNEVSHKEWANLSLIHEDLLPQAHATVLDYMKIVNDNDDVKNVLNSSEDPKKRQKSALTLMLNIATKLARKPKKNQTPRPVNLFPVNKNTYVKSSSNPSKYELKFGRVSKAVMDEMEEAVLNIMKKHYP